MPVAQPSSMLPVENCVSSSAAMLPIDAWLLKRRAPVSSVPAVKNIAAAVPVGAMDGVSVGAMDGNFVGAPVGSVVGETEGAEVGVSVGSGTGR